MKIYKIGLGLIVALLIMVAGGVPVAHAATAPVLTTNIANNFVIIDESGTTTTGGSAIIGNIGTDFTEASMTGYTCAQLDTTGTQYVVHSIDATAPALGTCTVNDGAGAPLSTAVSEFEAAYTNAAGQTAGVGAYLNAGSPAGTLSGTCCGAGSPLAAGVYTFSGASVNVDITGDIYLSGSSSGVWIFQIPGTLTVENGVTVHLVGGATYNNVFWQVAGYTQIGTTAGFQGIILDHSYIALQTGATLTGRAMSHTAVTLDTATISTTTTSTTTSSTSTSTTSTTTIVPEYPIGILVLAVPVLAIYLFMRGRGGSFGARIQLTDAWIRSALQPAGAE